MSEIDQRMALYESWTVEQLTRALTVSKWVLVISGVIFAFVAVANQWISDRVSTLQKREKVVAEKYTKIAQEELAQTKAKTVELENRLAPRQLTVEQRKKFIASVAEIPKGALGIVYISPQPESTSFVRQIRSLLTDAGFSIPDKTEYSLSYTIDAPGPWHLAIIVGSGEVTPYVLSLQKAFKDIGIDALGTNGRDIAKPGEIKIYVGSK